MKSYMISDHVNLGDSQSNKTGPRHGLRETIVRVLVGLENKDDLLQRVKSALAIAEKMKSELVF